VKKPKTTEAATRPHPRSEVWVGSAGEASAQVCGAPLVGQSTDEIQREFTNNGIRFILIHGLPSITATAFGTDLHAFDGFALLLGLLFSLLRVQFPENLHMVLLFIRLLEPRINLSELVVR
jgi:hypothetical protein